MKIDCFCTLCQEETQHSATLDQNNELVLRCDCGDFLKFPAVSPTELKRLLAENKKENSGRKFLDPAVESQKNADRENYLKALLDAGVAQ